MKYRTKLPTAKAELVNSNSEEFRAVASSIRDVYGFDLPPQMDLLYVRACLVSAGELVGVNDNDDIFTREEAWAARKTPVIKPFNWQHEDKDILGVMYSVQARSLDGETLDITDDTPPECDFDLFVEAAIFKLIHPDRSEEIESRAKSGKLFVSMEAWFDDYSYGFCDPSDGSLSKTIGRTENTSFLDKHLRVSGGAGVYRDPDSNQDVRIGRVLRSITFGGCGFVDRPANKRSVIEIAEPMYSLAERDLELQVENLLKKVLESQGDNLTEVTLMNTQANQDRSPEEVATAAVESVLDKRDRIAAEAQAKAALETRASEAEAKNDELEAKVSELSEAKEQKEAEVKQLETQIAEYDEVVENLIQEHTAAGATGSTPAEIAAIDSASGGEAAFSAKLAWIQKSMAGLRDRAARAAELETQLAEAEAVVREQEVRTLLGDNFSDEAIEVMVSRASELDNDAYNSWRDEKELMIIEMSIAAEDKEKKMPPQMKKKMEKEDKKECASENPFTAILQKRRTESGTASPDTPPYEPHLINPNGGDGVNSGVGADQLRTPRYKIAGSAGDDLADVLENAQADRNVSLAGSQTSDEGEGVNPFRSLANCVVDANNTKEDKAEKPSFDPIS